MRHAHTAKASIPVQFFLALIVAVVAPTASESVESSPTGKTDELVTPNEEKAVDAVFVGNSSDTVRALPDTSHEVEVGGARAGSICALNCDEVTSSASVRSPYLYRQSSRLGRLLEVMERFAELSERAAEDNDRSEELDDEIDRLHDSSTMTWNWQQFK